MDNNLNKRAMEVWELDLTSAEKTEILNKEFGKTWASRTWQQRAKNYGSAILDDIKTDEVLARRELNVIKAQKKNTLLRSIIHKETRKQSLVEAAIELANEKLAHIPEVKIRQKLNVNFYSKNKKLIEVVLADFQYKGGEEEQEYIKYIFEQIQIELRKIVFKIRAGYEVRFVFLGDDIEGSAAHDSQLLEINASAIQQTIEFSSLIITGLNNLYEMFNYGNKVFTVAFVPYSNHGMMGGKGKGRYQFPKEDLGLVIYDNLMKRLNKDIHLYEVDHDRMLVETEETIYLHGHQDYMRNMKRMLETLGVDKNIYMGHLHHFEEVQEGKRVIVKFGTLRMKQQTYENMAGYAPVREFAVVTHEDNSKTTKRVFV